MSTNRHLPPAPYVKGEDGRFLCRECGGPTAPPRRTFCSKECVDAYKLKRSSAPGRRQVFERDRGICEACGIDTQATFNRFRAELKAIQAVTATYSKERREAVRMMIERWKAEGWPRSIQNRYDFWDIDHRLPVIQGGGECGLDNLRTLCLKCHAGETAKLNAQLAAERRCGKRGKRGS